MDKTEFTDNIRKRVIRQYETDIGDAGILSIIESLGNHGRRNINADSPFSALSQC